MNNQSLSETLLQIIGIDAAVASEKTGVAIALQTNDQWRLEDIRCGKRNQSIADLVLSLIDPTLPVLVAMDAPLGWPTPLRSALSTHRAGDPIDLDPRFDFARETDRFVREKVGLKPIDIGADRIARTAAAALGLIAELRKGLNQALPLIVTPAQATQGGVIEVYPAATLKQRNLPYRQYKKPEMTQVRREIATAISEELPFKLGIDCAIDSDHCLDAAICVLAAIDFLAKQCHEPPRLDLLQTEGWIWFRSLPG